MTVKQSSSSNAGAPLNGFGPLSIAKSIWNYRVLCLAVWLLLSGVTLLVVQRLPAVYRAETSILIESQRIPENFVSSTVTPNLQDRLSAISDQILSYSRLTDLIKRFDLYHDGRKHLTPEEVVDQMRSEIKIKADGGALGPTGRPGAFQISYEGPNPNVVAQVTQQIGSFFVDENVRERSIEAEGTSEFLDSQLAEAKKRLEEQEAMLSQFKLAHNGELPEQENALIASSGQLKTELTGVQDAVNRAQQNKTILAASLSDAQTADAAFSAMVQVAAPASARTGSGTPSAPVQTESERLEEELAVLQARYGDQYPDVRHVKERLEQAREAEKNLVASQPRVPSTGASPVLPSPVVKANKTSPQAVQTLIRSQERVADLKAEIATADAEIAHLEKEREGILHDLSALDGHIQQLPVREQQLASVTRDYETTKAAYKSLLDKKLSADVAADMEKRQKAERFVMLDAARVPEKPIKPKRALLDGIGCAAALVIAVLLAVALELRKEVFLGEWELPQSAMVLGRIPVMTDFVSSNQRRGPR